MVQPYQDRSENRLCPATITSPIVTLKNNEAVANSLDVAEYFGKRHDNVLRDINALIEAAPACALNFEQTWIDVRMPNGGGRSSKTFDMTKDGFTLLAMGFTGSKALAFKLKYIAQFNAMEEYIKAAPVPALPNFSNPAEAARAWAEAYEAQQLARSWLRNSRRR